jgi:hypothetical protein
MFQIAVQARRPQAKYRSRRSEDLDHQRFTDRPLHGALPMHGVHSVASTAPRSEHRVPHHA